MRNLTMKSQSRAQSLFLNQGFLCGLCIFLFAVCLFAAANSSGLASDAFANASAQSNRKDTPRPLGKQCVTLRGPIVTLSTSPDMASVDTAPAAFNSQAD